MTGSAGGRRIRAVTVPAGAAVLGLLPDLARALDGTGPALLPSGAGDPRSAQVAAALRAGEPLASGEDDPADPTALVMATSGSTGTPKGVLLPAGALAASAAATERRLGGPGTWLLALPADHIAGMQVLLRAAAAGTEPVVLDTAEPFTARRFVAAARRLPGPRRYVSLVPTQLRRVLDDPAATATAAGLFDAILVGGAATPAPLLGRARAAGVPVVTTYGMTETCGGCVYDGTPLDGAAVTVAANGALVLSGPMVARGYRGRPGDPAFPVRGSFVTSDTGGFSEAGLLRVTGRLDDVIVSGGVNVAPGPVESALLALEGIADALVVGTPDPQWGQAVTALVVPGRGRSTAPGLARIRAALGSLPAAHRPQRIVAVAAIPLLPSGKPDRAAARRMAAHAQP